MADESRGRGDVVRVFMIFEISEEEDPDDKRVLSHGSGSEFREKPYSGSDILTRRERG